MQIEDIKELIDSADAATSATREEASDMLVFGRISQQDDSTASAQLKYRGQFDLIKPKRNKILSELWANPISVSFKPQDGADPDAADLLNGAFRRTMQMAEEATETAVQDQVDCGFGAFRFHTEYKSRMDSLDNTQTIKVSPINEANNRVYWDANSKRKDKSDAKWCLIITSFTDSGWEEYCEENGIKHKDNENPTSIKSPNKSSTWFWGSSTDEVNVGEFYHKKKKRERIFIYESPIGEVKSYKQREIKDVEEELADSGFIKIGEKYCDKWEVTKYIVDGNDIIKQTRVAGEMIPVVPVYGDWSFVEGREIWRGIYHDAADPQRLHNFLMNYTTDIVAQGPREKPIFHPGQIKGFEFMYADNGADNNYPYLLANELSDVTGQPYPAGPVGALTPPQIPQAQTYLMEQTRQSVDDVTGSTMNAGAMLNGQVTGEQIQAATMSSNMEAFLYQNSLALAMKQAGRIFASMAREVLDVPQTMVITDETGKESEVQVLESVFDYETGEEVILNDITKGEWEVYADTGPSYSTMKDQAKAELAEWYKASAGTPMGNLIMLTYMTLQDGPGFENLRKYANKELILAGLVEPETDEEKAMLQQAQQAKQQQQDPNMVLAMAEQMKAEADMADAQIKQAGVQVDAYNAETKRIEAFSKSGLNQANAQKAASEIKGNELDSVAKLGEMLRPARPLQ